MHSSGIGMAIGPALFLLSALSRRNTQGLRWKAMVTTGATLGLSPASNSVRKSQKPKPGSSRFLSVAWTAGRSRSCAWDAISRFSLTSSFARFAECFRKMLGERRSSRTTGTFLLAWPWPFPFLEPLPLPGSFPFPLLFAFLIVLRQSKTRLESASPQSLWCPHFRGSRASLFARSSRRWLSPSRPAWRPKLQAPPARRNSRQSLRAPATSLCSLRSLPARPLREPLLRCRPGAAAWLPTASVALDFAPMKSISSRMNV